MLLLVLTGIAVFAILLLVLSIIYNFIQHFRIKRIYQEVNNCRRDLWELMYKVDQINVEIKNQNKN